MRKILFWDEWSLGLGRLFVARTTKGLSYVGGVNETFVDLQKWATKYFPDYVLIQNRAKLEPYKDEMLTYLNGVNQTFLLPLDLRGTEFQLAVWSALQYVKYGEVVSYSWIAEKMGKSQAVRAVGRAIGANPVMIIIPCHRVIGKNGQLTGFRGGMDMKIFLLQHEGHRVDEYERVLK